MKKICLFILLIFLTLKLYSQNQSENLRLSSIFLEDLVNDKFDTAYTFFTPEVKAKLSLETLKSTWASIIKQVGDFKEVENVTIEKTETYEIIVTTCVFEGTKLNMRLAFNKASKIDGLYFVPVPLKKFSKPPIYSKPELFEEKTVNVVTGEYSLPGIFSFPKNVQKFPIVILIHGSGPNDMDETIGPNKPFRDIACGLASNGIAVLRFDKRTKVYGSKMKDIPNLTVQEEVMEDAKSAINLVKKFTGVDSTKIFVLGHSLGAMLSPRIAKENPSLKGIIMCAGNSRPLEELLIEQYNYLFAPDGISKEEQVELDKLKKQVEKLHSKDFNLTTSASELPLSLPSAYWLDLNNYKQKEVATSLTLKILILQGKRDYQVRMTDFEGWKAALKKNKKVSFISYSDLNHLFIEGKGKSYPEEYQNEGNVYKKVIDDIVAWMKKIN